jgi:hypothetical protein
MTSLPNFIKIYQLVQKLLGGTPRQTDEQTDRQTDDLISLTFLFKESRIRSAEETIRPLRQEHINETFIDSLISS